jgi:hypothetical protein
LKVGLVAKARNWGTPNEDGGWAMDAKAWKAVKIGAIALVCTPVVFGLVLGLVLSVSDVISPSPTIYRYYFPVGTKTTASVVDGKFRVRSMVQGAPPLPKESGVSIVRFDRSREIETSDEHIWGHSGGGLPTSHFFVALPDGGWVESKDIRCNCVPAAEHVPTVVTCNAE